MKAKIKITYLLLFLGYYSFGQLNPYAYQRKLHGINSEWHRVVLPDEIFEKVSPDLSDIRIFGITGNKDTVESPYILKLATEKISEKEVSFRLINQSKNDKGYYFTFEIPAENTINLMQLKFGQQNFDWKLDLEGSQDQREWFSVLEDYRILSIKNEFTNYQFTKLAFPGSRYRYFRVLIKSETKPQLISSSLSLKDVIKGDFRKYEILSTHVADQKQDKQTVVDIDLKSSVPVCNLKIFVKDKFDYYRPVTIQYLTDSIKTEKGWKYDYSTLTSGTLNSIEKNEFVFSSTVLKKLKIIIDNQDNKPLLIDSMAVKGYVYELIARFTDQANYYLAYGNKIAAIPNYDIERFEDKIPVKLTTLVLGEEKAIAKEATDKTGPLFQNKIWLWGIMVFMIVLLGWFSFKMLRQK